LNTGWKSWNKHLARFKDKKINILEIGCYKGEATKWFLDNLCTNPESKVYAVDTWGGSPEYGNADFKTIENIFNQTIKNSKKKKQLVKMKMSSYDALLKLNTSKKVMFDIIFIDASHEAIDVLQDAILSWNILNENGIIIFDDYLWDLLNDYHFRPKVAIDSFINIYGTQLDIISKGYQVKVQKRKKEDFKQPTLKKQKNVKKTGNFI
jgi:predicted O-methyltransferase YrrM